MDYYKDKLEILLKGLMILILLTTSADAATWNVAPSSEPGIDYTRIQDAINAAATGDTILARSGTYLENVNVNKQLTLQGVGAPVVDAGGLGRAITLNTDGCILDGFVAINSGSDDYDAGILVNSNNNTITGNTATGNGVGIWLHSSSNNKISGNTANNNTGLASAYILSPAATQLRAIPPTVTTMA
jgi:parallel beta-helix repeat protein